jgi:very-short-patch-repair endonuclease
VNLSISQITREYGLNPSHIGELTRIGVLQVVVGCTPIRPKYLRAIVDGLIEGTHYVTCKACGKWAGQITLKHLKVCSDLTLDEYKARWPGTSLFSEVVRVNREKSPEQRKRQSEVLKARFKTPEGEETREKIRAASRKLMQTSYREVLVSRLTEMNKSEDRRARASANSGWLRKASIRWHRENPDQSRELARKARGHIKDKTMAAARAAVNKTSRLHLNFKKKMLACGLEGFVTEGRVGPFEIDEAHYEEKLAVEIDGCWWHGCSGCGYPGVRTTLSNDRSKNSYLEACGWRILRLKGCEISRSPEEAISQVYMNLRRNPA